MLWARNESALFNFLCRLRWLDDLWQDAIYGLRVLLRNKAFTATAIVSLALGVGVNTVVFGILNTVLFNLP